MSDILIGTASWTDPDLIKSRLFYPPAVKTPEQYLRYYASQFPVVEVESSYYAMPSARNSMLWVERTPSHFIFNVKAYRLLTQHQTPFQALPRNIREALGSADKHTFYYYDFPSELRNEIWRQFIEAILPLHRAGKLGALHFQFPHWFHTSQKSFDYLAEVRDRLANFKVALEFRHVSWFSGAACENTLTFERKNGFINVIVDEPQGDSKSIPDIWEVTSPQLAIFRLHGRNTSTWSKTGTKTLSDRFNYDYSAAELTSFIAPVRKIAEQTKFLHVIFNNNYKDQAIRGVRSLIKLLAEKN